MSADYSKIIFVMENEDGTTSYYRNEEWFPEDGSTGCESCDRSSTEVRMFAQVDYVSADCTEKAKHDWPYSEISLCEDCLASEIIDYYEGRSDWIVPVRYVIQG